MVVEYGHVGVIEKFICSILIQTISGARMGIPFPSPLAVPTGSLYRDNQPALGKELPRRAMKDQRGEMQSCAASLLELSYLEAFAILASNHSLSLLVVDNDFLLRVPRELAIQAGGNAGEMAG